MRNCIDNHSDCASSETLSELPTQVLDVRAVDGTEDVRLHIGDHELGEYACLSYCWGGASQPSKLSRDTLSSFRQQISLRYLPQSIQDAVITVRGLELRYLWVDSLCIIQDSIEDKMQEIAKMSQIYSNATLTISAANGHTADSGFLAKRDQKWCSINKSWVSLPLRCRNGGIGSIFLVVCGDGPANDRRDPLHTRSWTLQEHVLSPRVLEYGPDQMYWICNDYERNNVGLYGQVLKDGGQTPSPQIALLNPFREVLQHAPKLSSEKYERLWATLVKEYSARNQKESDDRIHASGSLASRFQQVVEDEYIAGFWKRWILRGLCWRRCGPLLERPKRQYPTWSWLSIDSAVLLDENHKSYPIRMDLLEIEMRDCTVGSSEEDFNAFTLLPNSVLHLQGHLLQIEDPDWAEMRLFPTDPASKDLEWVRPLIACMVVDTKEERDLAVESFRRQVPYPVWCLAVARIVVQNYRPADPDHRGLAVQGLLLLEDSRPNHFRRIGRFCSRVSDEARFMTAEKQDIFTH